MRSLLAQKVEMTHIFDEKGIFVPVTLLWAERNVVTQLKNADKDGYESVQIGFGSSKKVSKPLEGHLKDSGTKTRKIKEITGDDGVEYKVGNEISVDIFAEGDLVDVQAISKGKGFAGTIKRHNFHRGPKTHGSHNYRAPGSIGAMFPQHVIKGQKMPGRMGATTVTTKNLKIAKIIKEENLILVRGAVPGPRKGLVLVTARKPKKEEKAE